NNNNAMIKKLIKLNFLKFTRRKKLTPKSDVNSNDDGNFIVKNDNNTQPKKYESHPQAFHTSRIFDVINPESNNNSNFSYATTMYDPRIPSIFEQSVEINAITTSTINGKYYY